MERKRTRSRSAGAGAPSSSSSSSSSSAAAAAPPPAARFRGPAADSALGERFLDVVHLVAAVGYAAEVSQCLFLCGVTFRRGDRGATNDMLEQSLRLQCGARAARAAAREDFGVIVDHDVGGQPAEVAERVVVRGTTQLIRAASLNNLPRVLQLVQLGAPLDALAADEGEDGNWRRAALHWACDERNEAVARALLDGKYEGRGAQVDVRGGTAGETPLMFAAFAAHEGLVRLLLARGASVGLQSARGHTALHCAASVGDACSLALLCAAPGAAGALELRDEDGATALMSASAAEAGAEAAVGVLLARGARADAHCDGGLTALHRAAMYGNAGALALLCAAPGGAKAARMRSFAFHQTPLDVAGFWAEHECADVLRRAAAQQRGRGAGERGAGGKGAGAAKGSRK